LRRLANLYHALGNFYCFFYAEWATRVFSEQWAGNGEEGTSESGTRRKRRFSRVQTCMNSYSILGSNRCYFVTRERRTRQFFTLCRQRKIVCLIGFTRVSSKKANTTANMSGSV
jgi:hypothetical protein